MTVVYCTPRILFLVHLSSVIRNTRKSPCHLSFDLMHRLVYSVLKTIYFQALNNIQDMQEARPRRRFCSFHAVGEMPFQTKQCSLGLISNQRALKRSKRVCFLYSERESAIKMKLKTLKSCLKNGRQVTLEGLSGAVWLHILPYLSVQVAHMLCGLSRGMRSRSESAAKCCNPLDYHNPLAFVISNRMKNTY